MSLEIQIDTRSAEVFRTEDVPGARAVWVENVVAIAATAFMAFCASGLSVMMYFG